MNRTKALISSAFWDLLEEKPYNKITVQNIVERCEINRNTFYYHFTDIPALVEYTVGEWVDEIIRRDYQIDSPSKCVLHIAEECARRRKACLHLYRSARREEFLRELNKMIDHFVQFYVDQAGIDFEKRKEERDLLVWFYKCLFLGTTLDWLDADMSYDIGAYFDKMYHVFAEEGTCSFLQKLKETET